MTRPATQDAGALFGELDPMARRYALHLTRHRQEAEDLAQDTLLKVWRIADRIPADADHRRAWLFRVCRNTYVSSLRKRRHPQCSIDRADAPAIADPRGSFEGEAELEALAASFRAPVAETFRLYVVQDRPIAETARVAGISRRTATRYLASIRARLRPELARAA